MGTPKHVVESEFLALRYKRGDTSALERLVALWERPLFFFVRRIVAREEDAWDVLQEVWIRVVGNIRRLRDPHHVVSWLYTIARNTAISHNRHAPREESFEDLPEPGDVACLPVLPNEKAEVVRRALDTLPLPQREALTLFFLEGFTIEEIAQIVEAPAGTVKSRLYYGKKALYETMRTGDQP